jgi:hypothetical protein
MTRLLKSLWLLLALLLLGPALSLCAQVPVAVPTIGGIPVHCTDATGATVYTEILPTLGDTAQSTIEPSGLRVIRINRPAFEQQPTLIKLFFYAHECGHHMSGDVFAGVVLHEDDLDREKIADRIGIRILRDQLNITSQEADQIASIFQNNPPIFPYYLPGPARARWIRDCYATSTSDCTVPADQTTNNDTDAPKPKKSDNAVKAPVSQFTSGYGVIGVGYLPLAQALPVLAQDMKDGFAFERKTITGTVVAADGIRYDPYDLYCILEPGAHDCSMEIFFTQDGPTAKSEYEKIKNVMTSALPDWKPYESTLAGEENPGHLIRFFELTASDNRRISADVQQGDTFKIHISLTWVSQ